MRDFRRIGAVGAFVMAFAYIVGMGLAFTVLDAGGTGDPLETVRFHVENYAAYYLWVTLIYVVAGAFLVPLCLALYERVVAAVSEARPAALLATAFGLIWAALLVGSGLVHNVGLGETVKLYGENPGQAALFWRMIETVHAGIGASIEIPGGLWTLLIAAAALRAGAFPKALNLFAIPVGAAGILSIVPPLAVIAVPLFALGQIVWWICIGVLMLRRPAAG